ncbi:hypothetical protein MSPP1_000365 [Malassezia sp. CBS 17886]|nr:hypothetical protein MSPP1_000365 [Malassezia sp. CBS 17886]
MPMPQSKNRVGLGHAIINRRAREQRDRPTSDFHTTDTHVGQGKSTKLQSVTHQGDLEEFLNTAQLADADFTAERRNVKVIQAPGLSRTRHNPYLLTPQQEADVFKTHRDNRERLRVPRRPAWNASTTPAQLERAEKDAFLDWRRGLAELQDGVGLVLTPFERNLEVWRQLWRVVERSQLLVQIVDARNPLRFRCEDLEKYVESLPANPGDASSVPRDELPGGRGPRNTLLLINKADLLDNEQRRAWAEYFHAQGVKFAFFSATDEAARQLAKAQREAQFHGVAGAVGAGADRNGTEQSPARLDEEAEARAATEAEEEMSGDAGAARASGGDGRDVDEAVDEAPAARGSHAGGAAASGATPLPRDPAAVLNVLQLEQLFLEMAPPLEQFARDAPHRTNGEPEKLTVGFVGYPNVGKSSTINALLGEKKVSVSATPGKTKHFQTIHLSPTTIICDCPGLVFPQFSTSAADLVSDGILPIDQMREYTAPADLVAQRIPPDIVARTYNIDIPTLSAEEGGSGVPTGLEILTAYARARGLVRQGQGNPDESRAARYVLKDYIKARLLFAQPPPGIDADTFNAGQHERLRATLPELRAHAPSAPQNPRARPVTAAVSKSSSLDSAFFDGAGAGGAMSTGRRRVPPALAGVPAAGSDDSVRSSSKKHHKGSRRAKQRSGAGYA